MQFPLFPRFLTDDSYILRHCANSSCQTVLSWLHVLNRETTTLKTDTSLWY